MSVLNLPGHRRQLTETEIRKIVKLFVEEKLPVCIICKRFGRSDSYVSRVLRDRGIDTSANGRSRT